MKTEKSELNKEDLVGMAIKDSPKFEVETVDDVTKIDFSEEDEIDIDKIYEFVSHTKVDKETKEIIEQKEADNVIDKFSKSFLDDGYIKFMKNGYDNLRNMLKKYDVNKPIVKNMSESDKDKIYGIAEFIFNDYQKKLNDMNFSFDLTVSEWRFLHDLLYNKIEYDQNEIFQMKEVYDEYFSETEKIFKNLERKSKDSVMKTNINVNIIILLYHLISKHKVKGINTQYYSYMNILTKIGERIKLFNAYNVWIQRLSNEFQLWGGNLTIEDELTGKEKKELPEVKPEK